MLNIYFSSLNEAADDEKIDLSEFVVSICVSALLDLISSLTACNAAHQSVLSDSPNAAS